MMAYAGKRAAKLDILFMNPTSSEKGPGGTWKKHGRHVMDLTSPEGMALLACIWFAFIDLSRWQYEQRTICVISRAQRLQSCEQ